MGYLNGWMGMVIVNRLLKIFLYELNTLIFAKEMNFIYHI